MLFGSQVNLHLDLPCFFFGRQTKPERGMINQLFFLKHQFFFPTCLSYLLEGAVGVIFLKKTMVFYDSNEPSETGIWGPELTMVKSIHS